MRAGGLLIIALAVAALFYRRKPIEDARDERGDGDCFPHPLSGAGGFLLSSPRADAGRGARTCVPVFYPDIEDDGDITLHGLGSSLFHNPEIRRD